MSITLPTEFIPNACTFMQSTNQRVNAAPFGGSEQAIDLLNDRWKASMQLSAKTVGEGAWIEAFIGSFRGQVNTVDLYHFARPAPRGTVRGTLTLNANASQGAASIQIAGCTPSNGTLLRGDMLGVGGLLVMVAADCTASGGVITVPITNRLRAAKSSGASVVWDKPTATFRLLSTSDVQFTPGQTQPVTFDFREKI